MQELVSVVIPTHNRSDLVVKAVESVLSQTWSHVEVIVVSDGSTDDTDDVMQALADDDARIRYISYYPGVNGNHARNVGIKASAGSFIAFLDDDDIWHPDKLDRQMAVMAADSSVGMVYTGIEIIYVEQGVHYPIIPHRAGNLSKQIMHVNFIGTTSTVLVRKETLEQSGLFDEELAAAQDYDLWIRICEATRVGVVSEALVDYYNFPGSNQISRQIEKYERAYDQIQEKYKDRYAEMTPREKARRTSTRSLAVAAKAMRNNERRIACQYIFMAMKARFSLTALAYCLFALVGYNKVLRVRAFGSRVKTALLAPSGLVKTKPDIPLAVQLKSLHWIDLVEIILLALILFMNAIRVVLRLSASSMAINGVYFLFIAFLIRDLRNWSDWKKLFRSAYFPLYTVLLTYSFASMVITGGLGNPGNWIKFVACILIAVKARQFTLPKIKLTLMLTVVLIALYAIYCIVDYASIYQFIRSSEAVNYLIVTLPLGFGLTLTLTRFLTADMSRRSLAYGLMTLVMTFALFKYSARGNILFPVIIAVSISLFQKLRVTDHKQMLRYAVLMSGVLIVLFLFFNLTASNFLKQRFVKLFLNLGQEPRIAVYRDYFVYVIDRFRWVLGIGFNRSVQAMVATGHTAYTYPHNFVLELFGELGLAGLAITTLTTVRVIRDIRCFKWKEQQALFLTVLSGLLFFVLSYLKSYSIYDAYLLFIMIAFMARIAEHERDMPDPVSKETKQ